MVRAALLLVGVLSVGRGYFDDDQRFLVFGVLLIVANALTSIVDMLTGDGRSDSD